MSRPYLESRRPWSSLALVAGMALGPQAASAIPGPALADLAPMTALAAGWLALLAAEPWDLATLRRGGLARALLMVCLVGLLVAAVQIVLLGLAGHPGGAAAALLLGSIALAVDPAAARESLGRAERPDAASRAAPTVASLALGLALAGSALAPGLHASAVSASRSAAAALALGVGLGLAYVGPLRLAEGKGLLLALLVSLPLLGWGLAARLGLSPLAVLFAAGVVLANDERRRDLLFALLKEMERSFMVALLLLAGAAIPLAPRGPGLPFWTLGAAFLLSRAAAWWSLKRTGLPAVQALPFSPLAIPLALVALQWGDAGVGLPPALALAFILGEAAWLFSQRRRGSPR